MVEVAKFAAYGCQCKVLHLKPWQSPPCWAKVDDQDNEAGPISGRRAAAQAPAVMVYIGNVRRVFPSTGWKAGFPRNPFAAHFQGALTSWIWEASCASGSRGRS
jgi:hypothetical protein